jgi:tetratricopeptide (TPR) repeat protein
VSWVLALQERYQEALAADQTVTALVPQFSRDAYRALVAFRSGNYPAADQYFANQTLGVDPGAGFKWLTISRRAQGRPREALVSAQKLRALEQVPRRDAAPYNALFEAAVWFDLGEYRRAAALFDSISRAPRDSTPSQIARNLVWTQSLRATALAALGDTAPLQAIADSVEVWGQRSSYGRDRRLHHHVRGLLLKARGRPEEAAAELERGIFSPVIGYTRTNVELARVLLRLNRPRQAAYWAEAGLRGPFDGPNSYATQTELAELAAVAWDAAGVRDSAARRYRQVIRNWTNAESTFGTRVERARLRLAMLERR